MPAPLHLQTGELPPRKVAWLHPLELWRTAYHAWLSTVATEYLDRREMLAALYPNANLRSDSIPRIGEHGLWIDFVADIGDSWEATYTVAEMMGRHELLLQGHPDALPHANVVVLGGDLVYPTPTRDGYRCRTRSPLGAALPAKDGNRYLLAIPGNHDWYDGLTSFVREFCQGGTLGGWTLLQRRSYFGCKVSPPGVSPGWWLWGIDIALDTRIDPPQQEFFRAILNNTNAGGDVFSRGDQVILFTSKPSWIRTNRYSSDAYRNLTYFVKEIVEQQGGHVPLILAGDLHHYCRYRSEADDRHLVISGGGGTYMLGTHHLPRRVPVLATEPPDPDLPPAAAPCDATDFPYPSRAESRRMALGAMFLAFRPESWSFCVLLGLMHLLLMWVILCALPHMARLSARELLDNPGPLYVTPWRVAAIAGLVVACVGYATLVNRRGTYVGTALWGLCHAAAHLALATGLAWWVAHHAPGAPASVWAKLTFYAVVFVVAGLSGATIVGVYLTLSDRLFGWHQNDVFAAQSIIDYRNFIRMHLQSDGSLVLYPIGLRRVPRKWRSRMDRRNACDSFYEPTSDIVTPHLIEGPIRILPAPGVSLSNPPHA